MPVARCSITRYGDAGHRAGFGVVTVSPAPACFQPQEVTLPELTLGVLRRFAGTFEAVFLAFLDAWIAGDQAFFAEKRLELLIHGDQGTTDAVADGSRLAADAATGYLNLDVELVAAVSDQQGLFNSAPVLEAGKNLVKRLAVDRYHPVAR